MNKTCSLRRVGSGRPSIGSLYNLSNPRHYLDDFTLPLTVCHTSFECRTGCLVFVLLLDGVSIVNFLSHREESGLQYIICLALHDANLRYTTLFTDSFDLRRHVTLGGKSPEPVSFAVEVEILEENINE